MNFLKAKKGGKKEEFESQASFGQLPPLSSESELYSELPNLPEAPETQGLPEIELPPPLKGLGDLDFPEGMGEEAGKGRLAEVPEAVAKYKTASAEQIGASPIAHSAHRGIEPLIPVWPKSEEPKLQIGSSRLHIPQSGIVPDLPAMPEAQEEKPWENAPAEVPELQMQIGPKPGFRGSLVSHKNSFFLKSDDFRTVKSDIDDIIRMQKKHHKLTGIKKEENAQFEHMSVIIEDAQRKLMHLDRTLFE